MTRYQPDCEKIMRMHAQTAIIESGFVRIVSLTSLEQKECQAEQAITLQQPHFSIDPPPRLGRSGASSARRGGVEG